MQWNLDRRYAFSKHRREKIKQLSKSLITIWWAENKLLDVSGVEGATYENNCEK